MTPFYSSARDAAAKALFAAAKPAAWLNGVAPAVRHLDRNGILWQNTVYPYRT